MLMYFSYIKIILLLFFKFDKENLFEGKKEDVNYLERRKQKIKVKNIFLLKFQKFLF